MTRAFLEGKVTLHQGDCREVLAGMEPESVDSCVTDPPYHLASIVKRFGAENAAPAKSNGATGVYRRASSGFMGKVWDGGDIAFDPATWTAVLRVLKPGAHLLAFGAPRNYHRMACAIEDAGFEVRDCLMWVFGSGFPKSHNVSKAIDSSLGISGVQIDSKRVAIDRWTAEGRRRLDSGQSGSYEVPLYAPGSDVSRTWEGWGTALKPSYEPIILARKPLGGAVAENVLRYGTGGLNIDGCRVELNGIQEHWANYKPSGKIGYGKGEGDRQSGAYNSAGRWPANLCHDGSEEVVAGFPDDNKTASRVVKVSSGTKRDPGWAETKGLNTPGRVNIGVRDHGDAGSAARFFYTAKADADDRLGSKHPTVKPVDLMRWLVRLVTPPGGLCLDLFAGTGTTAEACFYEGFRAVLIEREDEYCADIERRMAGCMAGPDERKRIAAKARPAEHAGPLFEAAE